MCDSSRCLGCSKLFSRASQALNLPSKQEQSDPLLRVLIGGLIWDISFHTSTVKRGVNCTDLGETWLSLTPKVFLLLIRQEGCEPKATALKQNLGFLRPGLRQPQFVYEIFSLHRVSGKRHFEKSFESPWLLSCVALSTEFLSDRILS